ncbi:membrane protein [Actinomycetes bacterium]|nr:membrane protein [Actinomycetes bacterium]
MVGLGTLINTATVLIGGTVGIAMGDKIPDRVRTIVVQVIGMVTIGLGLSDLLKTHNMVFPLLGMVFGVVIGEVLRIEDRLVGIGELIRTRFAKKQDPGPFISGFVTATLLFCIGPLTILGAIQDASGVTPQLYIIKGTLDGFMSVIFGAIHGVGVLFSAVSVFVVQGTLTLFGTQLDSLLNDRMRIELFATGGLAVMAIGLNLLDIKKIRLGSLLPGLIVTPMLVQLFADNTGLLR